MPSFLSAAKNSPVPKRRHSWPNTLSFPSRLRDAIPQDMGRMLELSEVDAHSAPPRQIPFSSQQTIELGARVRMKFLACETGKFTGKYEIWADLDIDAARALSETLRRAVERAERLETVTVAPVRIVRRAKR